jgi:two-component system sensor histidine kinase RegB
MAIAPMMTPAPHSSATLPREALQRLLTARLLLVGGEALVVALVAWLAPIRLPLPPMAVLLGLHGLLVGIFGREVAAPSPPPGAPGSAPAFIHLAADAALIGALVYYSGGYANPFISLLLVPLILGATLLRAAQAWAMTAWVAALYTLLMTYYQPLRLDMTDAEAVNLHLLGMWLSFLFSAVLVAMFVVRLTAALRDRDRALAEARETALRDERLFALGMQAAAAAHDLATPLSTLDIALEEMRKEYANDDELAAPLSSMAAQAGRMKDVLGRLREFAGAHRQAAAPTRPLDDWLADLAGHWRLMRPQARVTLRHLGPAPAPAVRDEPLLIASLTTLLNNAADASARAIELESQWDGRWVEIRVLDRGPGPAAQMDKPQGWGIGLQLADAALQRLGGRLELRPRAGGGTHASIQLPRAGLEGEGL